MYRNAKETSVVKWYVETVFLLCTTLRAMYLPTVGSDSTFLYDSFTVSEYT